MPLKRLLSRRRRLPRAVGEELAAELRSPVGWMYPWQLTPDLAAPVAGPELPSVHATRLEMIEARAREALRAAPERAVLDLGCSEGWFAHRALEWGAARVVGVDVRAVNVRRATLIRDHYGIPERRVRFEHASVFDLDPARLGTFDLVLVLGLIYHLENPIGALRVARRLTRGVAIVESQLTDQSAPIRVGAGQTGVFDDAPAHWAALFEPPVEQRDEGNTRSSYGGVVSLIPNRAALLQAMEVVGYTRVRMLEAPSHLNPQYVHGHRGIVVGEV